MLDADEAREKLVAVRNTLDAAAKEILETMRGTDERVQERAAQESNAVMEKYNQSVGVSVDRCIASFDQWEIREACPLNEDETFMMNFRGLLRDLQDFARAES